MYFDYQIIIGFVAGVLSFFAYLLYIITMVWGHTRPNRMTWWTLTAIGAGLAVSYYASGARETMWIALSYVIGPLLISLLSFKYGEGGWEPLDRYCLFGVVISVFLWWIVGSPVVALVANILVDFLALIPTIRKSVLRPEGEDRIAWAIESVANIFNLFAITAWTFAVVAYPLYLIFINVMVTTALWWPRKKLHSLRCDHI